MLYGSRCVLCGRNLLEAESTARICAACAAYVEENGRWDGPIVLRECQGADAALCYTGRLRQAMIAYKFRRRQSYHIWFAEQVGDCLEKHMEDWRPDGITYVPLGPVRWWLRGYNQSELIARLIAKRFSLPCEPTLRRRFLSRRQSSLGGAARAANAVRAFRMRRGLNLVGRRMVLLDDIITTGATVSACAALLHDAGCEAVFAVSVMKTGFSQSK